MTRDLNAVVIVKPSLKKISNEELVLCWYGEDGVVREFLVGLDIDSDFGNAIVFFITESSYHKERVVKSHNVRKRYGQRFFSAYLEVNGETFTVKVNPAMVGAGCVYPRKYSK